MGLRPHRRQDTGDSFRHVGTHQFSINPQHTIPEPRQHPVPPRIRGALQFMRPIIHFNYEFGAGRDEVNDVLSDLKLTTEGNAQLLAENPGPKNAFISLRLCRKKCARSASSAWNLSC